AAEPASPTSIALIEVASLAVGYLAADQLAKAARVEFLEVSPVSPGKMIIVYAGSVADLEIAHAAGLRAAAEDLIDQLLLARVHPDVLGAWRTPRASAIDALGILECGTVAAGILAADAAAKASDVELLEIHAARGIGGKTTVLFAGTVAQVEVGLERG